jgi:hypothetical protein
VSSIDQPFRRLKKFIFPVDGVDVASSVDLPKNEGKAVELKNLTVDIDGTLTTRPGLVDRYAANIITGKTPVHSMRRVSDQSGLSAMLYGVQDRLARESSSVITDVDGAYSGNPLTIIPWRPAQSPKSHAYVYDSARQRKIAVDSTTTKSIGIPPPIHPPYADPAMLNWTAIVNDTAIGTWTNGGVVTAPPGAPGLFTRLAAVGISSSVRVAGSMFPITGGECRWAIVPASLANIGKWSRVRLNNATTGLSAWTLVEDVIAQSSVTVVASRIYDDPVAGSGYATIRPSVPLKNLKKGCLINIGIYRVIAEEVIYGNDGVATAFRASHPVVGWAGTVGVTLINIPQQIHVHTLDTDWTAGGTGTIDAYGLNFSNTPAEGKGWIQQTGLSMDLSRFNSTVAGYHADNYSITVDDYFHLSVMCDGWQYVSMIRVILDVDDGTFEKNFYWYTIEQSTLLAASRGEQLISDAERIRRSNQVISKQRPNLPVATLYGTGSTGYGTLTGFENDEMSSFYRRPSFTPEFPTVANPTLFIPDGSEADSDKPGSAGTGVNQWAEVVWKRSAMYRSGNDVSKDWRNIVGVRIEFIYLPSVIPVTSAVGSLLCFGGGGLDVGQEGYPYVYRYRYRDSATGVVSDYSPMSRSGVEVYRNRVSIWCNNSTTADKIDIERYGGFQSGWCYIGTIPVTSTVFQDTMNDAAAERNATVSNRRVIQPWVRQQIPMSGTGALVAGSLLELAVGDSLSQYMIPGTMIIVDGVANILRRPIGLLSGGGYRRWELEIAHDYRSGTVSWEIPNPAYFGQPLGRVFGPFEGAMFACDGIYIRWTEGYDPDATHVTNWAEVTDPTDVTVGGFVYNGRAGVFTTHRMFSISGNPVEGFSFTEIPGGKGAISPWAIAVGPRVAWVSRDGIYVGEGGGATDITEDLSPLFPKEGRVGTNTSGLYAPALSPAEQPYLRLAYIDDGSLIFTYRDSTGTLRHMRYVEDRNRWFPYEYKVPISAFYALEGDGVTGVIAAGADAVSGRVYTVGGSTNPTTDAGIGFDCLVKTFGFDFGDPRSRKYYGDLVVDVNPANHTTGIAAKLLTDNHTVSTVLGNITGAARTQKLFDLAAGYGVRARNAALELSWATEANKKQRLHLYEMSLIPRPETINLRATDYGDAGHPGDKYFYGIWITADTFGAQKTLKIEYDGGVVGATIDINHNGIRREYYAFPVPFTARLVRIATADTDGWELYDPVDWQYEKSAKVPATIPNDLGYDGDKFMQGFYIDADTFGQNKIVRVLYDGGQVGATITINHSGRRREPYSFPTPFIARLVSVEPDDGVPWDLLDVDFRFNPEPPAAKEWWIQFTGMDIPGFKHMYHIRPALASPANVTMTLYADSSTEYYTYIIPATGGSNYPDLRRPRIILPAKKFKLWRAKLTSATPFRLYLADTEVLVKGWGSSGDYQLLRPFGDMHRTEGARI